MKFVSVIQQKEEKLGLEIQQKVFTFSDLEKNLSLGLPLTMQSFLNDWEKNMRLAEKAQAWVLSHPNQPATSFTKKLSPVPSPPSCRDAYAFRQHVETMRKNRGLEIAPEFDLFPVYYYTNHNAIIGEGVLEVQPDHLVQFDFELELAIVIGKKGRNIRAEEADDYICGFTIMNDFSARKLQTEEMKLSLGPAKGKDFATGLGPCLVTKDELKFATTKTSKGCQYALQMSAKHNGKKISDGNSQSMRWTFAQIIERISYGVDLYPGDVIGSGTVGTGCYAELNSTAARIAKEKGGASTPVWLQDGDTIELEIEGLGILKHLIKKVEAPYSLL